MFLTDRKLERRIAELEQYRYRDIIELRSFAAAEETQGVVSPKVPTDFGGDEWYTMETGDTWKGREAPKFDHVSVSVLLQFCDTPF